MNTDIENAWNKIMDKLSITMSSASFEVYIAKLTPVSFEGNCLILCAPSVSKKKNIEMYWMDTIRKAMFEIHSEFSEVRIVLPEEAESLTIKTSVRQEQAELLTAAKNEDENLLNTFAFDEFIVSDNNSLAVNAARRVAQSPGDMMLNPLFIYGKAGLGKTHIMCAIKNALKKTHPELKSRYITTDTFINEIVFALKNPNTSANLMLELRKAYSEVDVLLIDDIQFLNNKQSTQLALFNIFNDFYNSKKQIVITSDRPIKELSSIEERLTSRFASGIVFDIGEYNVEARCAILMKKSLSMYVNLSKEVIQFIADKEKNNIRILLSHLNKLIFCAGLNNVTNIDLEFTKTVFNEMDDTPHDNITISQIISVVANYFNITKEDLVGKKRNKEIVEPRQYAIYIITDILPTIPLQTIGDHFGGRDHSTISHARDKISREINENSRTNTIIIDLKNLIYNK